MLAALLAPAAMAWLLPLFENRVGSALHRLQQPQDLRHRIFFAHQPDEFRQDRRLKQPSHSHVVSLCSSISAGSRICLLLSLALLPIKVNVVPASELGQRWILNALRIQSRPENFCSYTGHR